MGSYRKRFESEWKIFLYGHTNDLMMLSEYTETIKLNTTLMKPGKELCLDIRMIKG